MTTGKSGLTSFPSHHSQEIKELPMFSSSLLSSGDMSQSHCNDGDSVSSNKEANGYIGNARDPKDEEKSQRPSPLIDSDGLCRPGTPLSPHVSITAQQSLTWTNIHQQALKPEQDSKSPPTPRLSVSTRSKTQSRPSSNPSAKTQTDRASSTRPNATPKRS